MDNDAHYVDHHRQLISLMRITLAKLVADGDEETAGLPEDLLEKLDALDGSDLTGDAFYQTGQEFICRLVGGFPQLTHLVARDLFWFFGGDCLHYMPDEEIDVFQRLDEIRAQANEEGEDFDYPEERASLLQLQ